MDLFAALAASISGMTNIHYQANLTQSVLQTFKRKVSMYRLACFTRPFHGFFSSFDWFQLVKICQHHWKEHLKISKIAKCESDLLITSEDITLQRRGTLKMLRRLCSSEKFAPLWSNVFTFFGHITLKLGKLPF